MNELNIPPQGLLPFSGVSGTVSSSYARPTLRLPEGKTFSEVLTETIAEKNLNIHFSAHARQRVESRQVELDPEKLARLDHAMDIAKGKGGRESLILLDGDAYVVNVEKRTVITAVNQMDAKGGVFTQIDSTVIL